jgi:hypothetical protein
MVPSELTAGSGPISNPSAPITMVAAALGAVFLWWWRLTLRRCESPARWIVAACGCSTSPLHEPAKSALGDAAQSQMPVGP